MAKVNGLSVPYAALEVWAAESRLDLAVPEQRTRALDTLIDAVVLAQRAESEGLMLDPKVRTRAALARVQSMGSAVLASTTATPIEEAELRAAYEAQISRFGGGRYQFDEWVFDNEAAALEFAGQLLKAPEAATAANAVSQRSAEWVDVGKLSPALVEALGGLADGEARLAPLKTEAGWHLLRRLAAEVPAVPAFEQVKDGLRRSVMARRAQDVMKSLRTQAKVEKLEVPG